MQDYLGFDIIGREPDGCFKVRIWKEGSWPGVRKAVVNFENRVAKAVSWKAATARAHGKQQNIHPQGNKSE